MRISGKHMTKHTRVEIRHHRERLEGALLQVVEEMKHLGYEGYRLDTLQHEIHDTIWEYTCNGGKRFRPLLFIAGYKAYAQSVDEQVYKAAISIELLHDFVLIHDDIIDNADMRRGKPSLQRYLEMAPGVESERARSEAFALVAGDMVYTCALHTFLGVHKDPTRVVKALRELTSAGVHTAMGQLHEMSLTKKSIGAVSEEEIFDVYDRKTSFYSFAAPLAAGALLAGASYADARALSRGAIELGRGFQIYDDLIDLMALSQNTGKDGGGDFTDGVRTIPIVRLFHECGEDEREWLRAHYASGALQEEDIARIQRMLKQHGISAQLEQQASQLYENALSQVKQVIQSDDAFDMILQLMFKIFDTHMQLLHTHERSTT